MKLEQVILTPHIGSNTVECMDRIALDVAEDVHLAFRRESKHPLKIDYDRRGKAAGKWKK